MKKDRREIQLSLLCGLSVATTFILQPIIRFYQSNEGEFWFSLDSVLLYILLAFFGIVVSVGMICFFLPKKNMRNAQTFFLVLMAAISLCIYIQGNFMTSYLPVLTGDIIDWNKYTGWNLGSILLWIGIFTLLVVAFFLKTKFARKIAVGILAFLLFMGLITSGAQIITAKHENKKGKAYFSNAGLYDTVQSGNIVVIVSDTFEGTYMNEILERYPEYRELLSDITYYDNTTGIGSMTYFSYAKLLTGVDFPLGLMSEQGIKYCFENESIISRINNNGWDVAYYTEFSPSQNVENTISNYASSDLRPNSNIAWSLTKLLIKSTMFQNMPHPMKPLFVVYTRDYNYFKDKASENKEQPYTQDDVEFYNTLNNYGLNLVTGKPKYSIYEFWGVHHPLPWDKDYNMRSNDDSISIHERKLDAARASLKMLQTYLNKLKEAGTYDETTVIMMADHGYNLRFYPVFLVKEAHRKEKGFIIDNTPLSLTEDYENFIIGLTEGRSFSEMVLQIGNDKDRIRYANNYKGDSQYGSKTVMNSTVVIDGQAKDISSYTVERDTFFVENKISREISFGDYIIKDYKNMENAEIYGINEIGWTYGHTIMFNFLPDKKINSPYLLKIDVEGLDKDQVLIVSANSLPIGEITVGANKHETLQFEVPVFEENRICLEIDLPYAVLDQYDSDVLTWNSYHAIRLKNVYITEKEK